MGRGMENAWMGFGRVGERFESDPSSEELPWWLMFLHMERFTPSAAVQPHAQYYFTRSSLSLKIHPPSRPSLSPSTLSPPWLQWNTLSRCRCRRYSCTLPRICLCCMSFNNLLYSTETWRPQVSVVITLPDHALCVKTQLVTSMIVLSSHRYW